MKKLLPSFVVLAVLALFSPNAHAQLSITTTTDAATLAGAILGGGISLSNLSYIGGTLASGTYTGGAVMGIPTGIIMTSGNATLANGGTNDSDSSTGSNGTGTDADLNTLSSPFTTFDKTILEFDFESTSGDLFFQYVFASEEYNEYANSSFNDVFGFFLDGTNIALIPGTSTPVSINNINLVDNPSFFNNNDLQDGGVLPFEYDGFTDIFTAEALGLTAGTHHIKLAIADAGDSILDSAVFIKGGSFSSTNPGVIPEPTSMLLLGSGLIGSVIARRRKIKI